MPREPDILLDVTRLVWRVWTGRLPTGIDRVCLAYLDHYGPRALAVVQRKNFRLILAKQQSEELFALLRRGGPSFRIRLLALLAKAFMTGGYREPTQGWIYLNVGHTGLNDPGLAQWLHKRRWKPVFLVHDLIPISHPQFCRPGEANRHRKRIETVLDCASSVIVNSAATGAALADFAKQTGKAAPPMTVAWLAADTLPAIGIQQPSRRPVFVTIGTIEGRKNHLLLLKLWQRLVDKLGADAPELVLIGQRGWQADEVFALLDNSPELQSHVHELGRCDDHTMLAWLAQARAVLLPSFIEGFGIPVVEALQCGVPVIASDLPVFQEIAGEIPLFLDPHDEDAWEAAILEYCTDHSDRSRQLATMPAYQAPTWHEHFVVVDDLLAALA